MRATSPNKPPGFRIATLLSLSSSSRTLTSSSPLLMKYISFASSPYLITGSSGVKCSVFTSRSTNSTTFKFLSPSSLVKQGFFSTRDLKRCLVTFILRLGLIISMNIVISSWFSKLDYVFKRNMTTFSFVSSGSFKFFMAVLALSSFS